MLGARGCMMSTAPICAYVLVCLWNRNCKVAVLYGVVSPCTRSVGMWAGPELAANAGWCRGTVNEKISYGKIDE